MTEGALGVKDDSVFRVDVIEVNAWHGCACGHEEDLVVLGIEVLLDDLNCIVIEAIIVGRPMGNLHEAEWRGLIV